jgi:DNA-directed RNA polymerase subunit RPC12/RpoP
MEILKNVLFIIMTLFLFICPLVALGISITALKRAKRKYGDVRFLDGQLQRLVDDSGEMYWDCLDRIFVKQGDFNKFRVQLNCEHKFEICLNESGEQTLGFRCPKCGLEKRVLKKDLTEAEKKAIDLVTDFKIKERK